MATIKKPAASGKMTNNLPPKKPIKGGGDYSDYNLWKTNFGRTS